MLLGGHDYDSGEEEDFAKYADEQYDGMLPQGFALFADGERRRASVFNGVRRQIVAGERKGRGPWGYSGAAANEEAFLKQLESLMKGVYSCRFQGYCYTQLTDVRRK